MSIEWPKPFTTAAAPLPLIMTAPNAAPNDWPT
jgi:hypothetical protein